MGKNYDANTDYMKLIQEAVSNADMEQAAYYEEKRNEKILGEGLTQYSLTHTYEDYLPKTTAKKMEQVLAELGSRESFSYDLEEDKLYNRYKEQYTKAGRLAREEAAAQAAALTGGYGNSYGQTAGQSAYDQELDRLMELVPELYDRAKAEYDAQGDLLIEEYDRLAKELDRQQEETARLDKAEEERREKELEEAREEKEKAYSFALTMLNQGLMPSQDILSKSGIDPTDAEKLYSANLPKEETAASGSGSGKGSSSSAKTGTSSVSTKTDKGTTASGSAKEDKSKTLSNTMWEKLRDAYQKGSKAQDLTDFFRLRTMMEAQGYDIAPFDTWARSAYGEDYTTGGKKIVDTQSILDLGYGPISNDTLAELLASGEAEQYTQGDYIRYRKAKAKAAPVLK